VWPAAGRQRYTWLLKAIRQWLGWVLRSAAGNSSSNSSNSTQCLTLGLGKATLVCSRSSLRYVAAKQLQPSLSVQGTFRICQSKFGTSVPEFGSCSFHSDASPPDSSYLLLCRTWYILAAGAAATTAAATEAMTAAAATTAVVATTGEATVAMAAATGVCQLASVLGLFVWWAAGLWGSSSGTVGWLVAGCWGTRCWLQHSP
jgi:hypothetical protein